MMMIDAQRCSSFCLSLAAGLLGELPCVGKLPLLLVEMAEIVRCFCLSLAAGLLEEVPRVGKLLLLLVEMAEDVHCFLEDTLLRIVADAHACKRCMASSSSFHSLCQRTMRS